MKRVKDVALCIGVMGAVSMVCLFIVSLLTYLFKWYADKALIGITVTYILTGFIGGKMQKSLSFEENITKKLFDGICLGSIFMVILLIVSIFVLQNPFVINSRFLMIWMLLVGSACLGRIL